MTAPALVALAHGSRDPRSAETIKALCAEVRNMRPDLRIEPAFLELSKPSFSTVVDKLVRAGYDEIVVVQERDELAPRRVDARVAGARQPTVLSTPPATRRRSTRGQSAGAPCSMGRMRSSTWAWATPWARQVPPSAYTVSVRLARPSASNVAARAAPSASTHRSAAESSSLADERLATPQPVAEQSTAAPAPD